MKKMLTNNLTLKLLSVVAAIMLWLVVMNIDDPYTYRDFSPVQVTMLNENVVTDQGKVYKIEDGSDVISLRVWGKKSILRDLNIEYFTATADMQKSIKYNDLVGIEVSCSNKNIRTADINMSRENVVISVEDAASEQFNVVVKQNGKVADGYMIGAALPEQSLIQINGPASVIAKIKRVEVEIKTTGDWNKIKTLKAGEIPNDWLCQMTHYMAVTGYERWDLAALAEGRELYVLTLNREEEDIRALMQAEREFWQCVQSREPPGVDGSKATAEALGQLYQSEDTGACVLLDPVAHDLEHLLQLKAEKKELEARIKEAENVVKAYMGTSESGAYGNVSVTWKTVAQTAYDTKALCREHPDLARQYKRISTSRRFTIKED